MKKTGFLYDDRYQEHLTGNYHPEVPDRLPAVYKGIQEAGLLEHLTLIKAVPADIKWVETVHDPQYIKRFAKACNSGNPIFDSPDNQMCTATYQVALLAVGGVLEATRLVMEGELDNAFCAVRPPGHHAEVSQAMGFCYFNNVAIAARYIQQQWDIQRVGIVDFDVHHGNGTQHIFERDPTVFYYSIHQHPTFAYPGTGREFETGKDAGHGYTKNSPMLPGHGDKEYQQILQRDLVPAFAEFKPQVILVSSGFDAHIEDNMSDIKLTTEGFTWIIKLIVELAAEHAQGRLISVLEGGYSIRRLPELARNHIKILMDA
ncbi:MAG: histone deacetylase [Deltaproteobacteria bacterium]|jgi:acetoin utilization deacetylase AcuC-like enzyme|nr:histone deacetylase [Deltaproteobacteria bacterium]MBW2469066.1 histone deacetylase [Deltaproteobacteria bacterium]MBW2515174.1 histone deacetylase [Deltaproteobacteria bacterium]